MVEMAWFARFPVWRTVAGRAGSLSLHERDRFPDPELFDKIVNLSKRRGLFFSPQRSTEVSARRTTTARLACSFFAT